MPARPVQYSKPRWDKAAQQFGQQIGYHRNQKDIRVRKRWYFLDHEKAAISMSIEKQKKWEKIVEECRQRNATRRLITPDAPLELPEWPKEGVAVVDRSVGNKSTASNVTIRQAYAKFLDAKKATVGLMAGRGIKPATYNGIKTMLTIALGLSTAKIKAQVTRKPIDVDMPLNALTKTEMEFFINFWTRMPEGIKSVRTAINYCNHFKHFIDWCDSHEQFGFNKPKGTDDLFIFRGMKKTKVEKYDPEKLKKLFAAALLNSDKALLYCLLAFQCGHYQADIGGLLQTDLKMIDGEPFLWRKRTKRTAVNEVVDSDDEAEEHALQYLWPETYHLLKKHMATRDQPLMLLNQNGDSLYEEKVDQRKRDNIGDAYEGVQETAGFKLTLKQLRKITWNGIKKIGNGNLDLARKWSGQRVQGVAQSYNVDEFDDVTAALRKWREELIEAKVLPKLSDMPVVKDKEA